MRRVLPPNAKIADDAKETVQQCVTEYINMVTSEANDRCHGEERRTITADDILWAMERLGFDNYAGHLSLFLDRYRNLQREWNEESAEPLRRRAADFERLPPPTYGLLPAFPPGGVFGRSSADAMAGMNTGYYADNAGASSSSSSARQDGGPGFGPYAQFKR
ncbi:hypothetical protein Vadar_017939 [Vaccinium darrowii]|uniref:Uncharacterized protein n=1 Tax=Vaccinium darrowii TaxID=229202 RepID=A0ACB7XSG1_9ERIC|nr:hypothetical protein Vadar_017939 [Vaccinium darrowii]